MFGNITILKQQELLNRMKDLEISENEIEEKFIRASGKGGQKINKTSSCVQLKHLPTKIIIKSQKSRNRPENRFFARRLLCEKIENMRGIKNNESIKIQKIRKQKDRQKRRAKD